MGAISKHVLSDGEWCAPTRELKNSKLLKLVHQTRKIITETGCAAAVEVTPQEDVVLLVNRKPDEEPDDRAKVERSAIAPISHPMYRDSLRPLRVALAVMVPLAAVAAVLLVLLAR